MSSIPGRVRNARLSTLEGVALLVSGVASLLIFNATPLLSAVVFVAILRWSVRYHLPSAIPVMLFLQWAQICAGLFYYALTGRIEDQFESFDATLIVCVNLVYLLVLFLGICLPVRRFPVAPAVSMACRDAEPDGLSWDQIKGLYLIAMPLAVAFTGAAYTVPAITQQLIACLQIRYVILYAVLAKAIRQRRWHWFVGVIAVEVLIGFTGYFSAYRVSLNIALIAVLDAMRRDRRADLRRTASALFAGMVVLSVVWTLVKAQVRQEWRFEDSMVQRLERVAVVAADRLDAESVARAVDALVLRVWDIYYPALVLERVPRFVAHEEGELLLRAVRHVLVPRVLDPTKPRLISDSELVRQYAGVWVAGEEQGTSVGLSYVAESYIDFGYVGMYLPLFAYGLLVGGILRVLLTRLRVPAIREAGVAIVLMTALNQYGVPWTKVLGSTLTTSIVLGLALVIWDRRRRPSGVSWSPARAERHVNDRLNRLRSRA